MPVHEVSDRLGHVDLRTAARYAATRPERVDEIADVLHRRHQAPAAGAGCSGLIALSMTTRTSVSCPSG